jgi:hypothetical protein
MAAKKTPRPPRQTPTVTKEEAVERYAVIEQAIRQESYQIDEMESAIGMYAIGFHYGWKVLHLVHTKKTIAKYEALLGIKVREVFDPFGHDADRTNAYKIINSVTNFWKLVSGDVKSPVSDDKRTVSP